MKIWRYAFSVSVVTMLACLSVQAMAEPIETETSRRVAQARGAANSVHAQSAQPLPPPRSFDEPPPPAPAPTVRASGITEQAGVGGTQAYARAGVLELGGAAGFSHATDFTQLNISPQVGWFFIDNLELSAIVGFHYINTGGTDSTFATGLVEPSYHLPFTDTVFGFLGVGAGLSYSKGPGAGFAVAPRLGANILVGRSGILTPALQLIYTTSDAVQTAQGTLLGVSTSYGINVGFTVMW